MVIHDYRLLCVYLDDFHQALTATKDPLAALHVCPGCGRWGLILICVLGQIIVKLIISFSSPPASGFYLQPRHILLVKVVNFTEFFSSAR